MDERSLSAIDSCFCFTFDLSQSGVQRRKGGKIAFERKKRAEWREIEKAGFGNKGKMAENDLRRLTRIDAQRKAD